MRQFAALAVLFWATCAAASPWDRDRPGDNFAPSVADACAGRFDHFPPEYYQARVERLEAALKDKPLDNALALDSVDDLAIALLRLGKHANAVIWLDRKLAPLEALRESDPRLAAIHLDRTLKNKAHCLLERFKANADPADLQRAMELLRQAETSARHIHENWFLAREAEFRWSPPSVAGPVLPNVLGLNAESLAAQRGPGALSRLRLSGAIEHLALRVTHGGQGQDPDLFYALSLACAIEGRDMEAAFAVTRAIALVDGGARPGFRHSLSHDNLRKAMLAHLPAPRPEEWRSQLAGLEAAAAQWRADRDKYVRDRLARSEHPDTHAAFWAGWRETVKAPLAPAIPEATHEPEPIVGTAMFIGGGAMILFLFLVVGGMAIYFARRHPPGPNVDEL